MNTVYRIAGALVAQHDVHELAALGVGVDEMQGLDFAGAKHHWGSVGLVGLVRTDGLDRSAITARTGTFHALTRSLHRHARVLTVFTSYGSGEVKLGSFGVLCFVFEQGCDGEMASFIRKQRTGSAAKKEYTLAWSIDVPARKVRDHGLLPRGVFPPKRWVEGLLHTSAPA